MYIKGQIMRLKSWTPTFILEVKTPLVPIWAILLELLRNYYCMEVISPLLSPIGKLYLLI